MASDFAKRQAEWAKKEQAKEAEERKGEVKVGEVIGKTTGDIKKTDNLKIKIDHAETLQLRSAVDYNKGDSVKIIIEADSSMRGKKEQNWGRERSIQPGEAFGKIDGNIRQGDEIKVKIDNIDTFKFKSPAEFKKGDNIRVIIIKP
jgi:hypothetical protein